MKLLVTLFSIIKVRSTWASNRFARMYWMFFEARAPWKVYGGNDAGGKTCGIRSLRPCWNSSDVIYVQELKIFFYFAKSVNKYIFYK